MTIINQKRDVLINYDKVNLVLINPIEETQIRAYFDRVSECTNGIVLGTYKTKERAKEVFMELFHASFDRRIYIMPEE